MSYASVARVWIIVALALPLTALAARAQTPRIRLANLTVAEGNTGSVEAVLTLTLSAAATGAVTVAYATENVDATGGAACGGTTDYVTESGTVQINPGETSQPLGVGVVCGDTSVEVNEAFRVRLSNAIGATIEDATVRVTITNDDVAALPILSFGDIILVTEGNAGSAPGVQTITLSAPSASVVTVDFSGGSEGDVNPGAACGGVVDFIEPRGTVRFDPGVVSRTVSVVVCGDVADEPDESFSVRLSNAAGASLIGADGKAVGGGGVRIIDDDAPGVFPQVSINNRTVPEGDAGSAEAVLRIRLSTATTHPVTVSYASDDQTARGTGEIACDGNSDYVNVRTRVQFNPGETNKDVRVIICPDTRFEEDEIFRVELTSAEGATIQDATGRVTISNDDAAAPVIPTVSVSDATIVEPDRGAQTLSLFATLSSPSSQTVRVPYSIVLGTATRGSCDQGADIRADVLVAANFTFNPGETTSSVSVAICGDTTVEPDETFQVKTTNPSGAVLGDSVGQVTITNNDPLPTLAITSSVAVDEPELGEQAVAVFSVTLSGGPTTATVSVAFATVPGTARPGSTCAPSLDFLMRVGVLTFSPGTTTRQIQVPICGDIIVNQSEGSETFTVNLSNSVNATIASGTGRATIRD